MAEYIERDALRQAVLESQHDNSHPRGWAHIAHDCEHAHFVAMIARFPAADVAPVVHGRWDEVDWVELESGGHELIRTPNAGLRCSNCRNCFKKELLWKNNYCPNCGAKMDGGADNA